MNELTNSEQEQQRNIEIVTTEIISLRAQAQTMALMYVIEIGRRLTEAKALLPHGEWGNWLTERVDFSQKAANNFMRLYNEYGTEQFALNGTSTNLKSISNLDYTKVLKLLAIPADEREDFIDDNDVENLSTRELDKLIKERDEALEKAKKADELAESLENAKAKAEMCEREKAMADEKASSFSSQVEELTQQLNKAKENEKNAKSKYKNLKDNPTVSQETLDKLKSEAEAKATDEYTQKIQKAIDEANKKIEEALAEKKRAIEAAESAKEKVLKMEKEIQMADPVVTEFKTLFTQVQEILAKADSTLEKVKENNSELAEKLHHALDAALKTHISGVEI